LSAKKFCEMFADTAQAEYQLRPDTISWIKSRNALTLAGGRWREGW
jgi:hypothetical protein